jgi:SAM-dependent methyltransferase
MTTVNSEDRKRIEEGLRQKYVQVAISPEGNFQYPTGKAGLKGQNYNPDILNSLPDDVLSSYCGVGNPFSLGPINEGETVLDVGCGAGVDSLVAAKMVGPSGKVVGIDLIPEMLDRARKNLELTTFLNVSFEKASAEDLPFPDASFDVVISNGVINLIPDKLKALKEVHRVLKPFGRLMMADQVLTADLPEDAESMVANWAK